MTNISSKRRSRLGVSLLSTGFNVALFAGCNPALAHGGNGPIPHMGWSSYPASQSHSAGGISPHFGASTATGLTHPHSTNSALASSLSIGSTLSNGTQTGSTRLLTLPHVTGNSAVSMDLTSSDKSIVLTSGLMAGSSTVTILVGSTDKTFHSGDSVTPAELVAICQVRIGAQTIVLDNRGRADGGSFSLNSLLSSGGPLQISELVVPKNVSALDYLSASSNIQLSGDLLNYGSIIDVSKGGQNLSVNLSALDIVNEPTGQITTGSGGISGGAGAASAPVNLALNATNDFTNLGAISSNGNLAITAGGYLANGSTISGAQANNLVAGTASIKAASDISLQSATIVNNALVSSINGNVNLGTGAAAGGSQTLNFNNTNGTVSALNGAINVRDSAYSGSGNANINGGNLLAQQINLYAGAGTVNVNVDELTGIVNSTGNAVHVEARTQDLVLGTQNLSGDPTFYNDSGDISITGNINVQEDLAIVASGNITATNALTQITAVDPSGQGRAIFLIAGANVTGAGGDTTSTVPGTQATGSISFSGASASGGDIDLSAASPLLISATSSANNLNGGSITMAAFASGSSGGHILLPNGTLDANGNGTGTPGNISLIAGAASGTAISLNSVNAVNQLLLLNYQPTVLNGPMQFSTNGSVAQGSIFADFTKPGGGDINVSTGIGMTSVGSVNISAGGSVFIGSSGINPNVLATTDAITITAGQNITTSAAIIVTGNTGNINMVAGGDIVGSNSDLAIGIIFPTTQTVSNINIVAGAAFTQDGNQITITGASKQVSGDINFSALNDPNGGIGVEANTSSGGVNVTLVAFGGTSGVGNILLGSSNINSNGFGSGKNGAITFVANGAISNTGANASISAAGGQTFTGSVTISSTNPLASATNPVVLGLSPGAPNTGSFLGGQIGLNATSNPGPITVDNGNLTLVQAQPFTINGPLATGSINSLVLQTLGNVSIQSNISVYGNLAIIAGGSITATNALSSIETGESGTLGGSIFLVAGAQSAAGAGGTTGVATFSGSSLTGGDIDFSQAASNLLISSAGTGGINGGNLSMIAFASSFGSGVAGGHVLLPNASVINAAGIPLTSGNVTIIAGAVNTLSQFTAVNVGLIGNGAIGANNVSISNVAPLIIGGLLQLDANGQIAQGSIGPDFTQRGGGDIITQGAINASGNVQISAGGNVSLSQASGSPIAASGALTVVAPQSITFNGNITANGGIVMVAGVAITAANTNLSLSSSSALSGTSAGNILMVSGAAFTEDSSTITITGASNQASSNLFSSNAPGSLSAIGSNSAGGNISLVSFGSASTGQINLGSANLNTGGSAANNGNISLISGFQAANGILSTGNLTATGGNGGSGNITISYSTPNASATSPVQIDKASGNLSSTLLGGQIVAASSNTLTAPAMDRGNLTIVQGADIFVTPTPFFTGSVNKLTLESGHNIIVESAISSNSVALLAGNSINLESGTNFTNQGGVLLVASRNIATVSASNVVINTSSTNGGGAITLIAGAAFSLGDGQITITGPSTTGGLINLTSGGNVTTFTSQGIGESTPGGNITLLAFNGTDNTGFISLPTGLTVSTFGDNAANGFFTLMAGSTITNSVIGSVTSSDTAAGGNPAGSFTGTITLSTYNPGVTSSNPLIVLTNGFLGSGGQIPLGTPGQAALVVAGSLTANSSNIIINAAQNVQINSVDVSAITNSWEPGGSITITANGTSTLVIGVSSGANFIFSLNSSGDNGGDHLVNGSISVANLDPFQSGSIGIQLANTLAIQQSAGGGGLSFMTSSTAGDTIDLGANNVINLSGTTAETTGGTISLIGSSIIWNNMSTANPLLLIANGENLGGSGGSITYETASASPLIFGNNQLVLAGAAASIQSGNGGSLTLENAGNIVYNPAGINPVEASPTGNGGTLTLAAGYYNNAPIGAGNSSLLVTGKLNVNGSGGGSGGQVFLFSNTTAPFNVGLTKGNTNGVEGNIDVSGAAPFGLISITNNNGGIVISTPETNVGQVYLTSGGANGSVTLGSGIGGSNTSAISILAGGNISETSAKAIVTADNLILGANATGSIGGASAFNVNATSLAASAQSNVKITDSASTPVTLSGSSASGSFSVSAPNSSLVIGSNQQVTAFFNLSLSALVNVTVDTGSLVKVDGFGNLTITATTGNIITQSGSDFSALGNVQLQAPAGSIFINSIGGGIAPSEVSVIASNGITINSNLFAVNSVSLKTTGTASGQGTIVLANSIIGTSSASGTVSVVSAAGNIDDSLAQINSAAGITLSATNGSIAAGELTANGSKGSISVNGFTTVTITGNVTATNSVTIKTLGAIELDDTVSVLPLIGTISITSTGGSINALPGSSITGGSKETISAPVGSITVDGVGSAVTGSVSLVALTNITATNDLNAQNSINISTVTGQVLLFGSVNSYSPTSGGVTISTKATSLGSPVIDVQGITGSQVTLSAPNGSVNVASVGVGGLPSNKISITGGSGITVLNSLLATDALTLKTTLLGPGSGDIVVNGVANASSSSGAVSMTAAGTQGITIIGDVSGGKSVTLTAKQGSVSYFSAGLTVSTPTVTIMGLNDVNIGLTQVTGALSATASAKSVADGLINVDGPIDATGASGTVTLTGNNMGVSTTLSADISAGKSVTLQAPGASGVVTAGSIGLVTVPGTVTIKAGESVSVQNNVTAGTGISIVSTTASTGTGIAIAPLANLTTQNGPINLLSASSIVIGTNSALTANSTSKSGKAAVTLESANKTAGTILFDGGTSVTTSGPGGGNIEVSIGTLKLVPGTQPGTVTVNKISGLVFFGPAGLINTAASAGTINLQGANVVFSGTSAKTGAITFVNTIFTADPPLTTSGITPTASFASNLIPQSDQMLTAPTQVPQYTALVQPPTLATGTAGSITAAFNQFVYTPAASLSVPYWQAKQSGDNQGELEAITSLSAGAQSKSLQGFAEVTAPKANQFAWISDTEIDGGEIPVTLLGDVDLEIGGANVADLQIAASKPAKIATLARGSILTLSEKDTVVKTTFGDVKIAGRSLALVMAWKDGIAVYNLDDRRQDSVTFSAAGKQLSIRPGTSAVIVADDIKAFEHCNPAQLVAYRRTSEQQLNCGLKAYRSEFSMQTAIAALKPLRSMIVSNEKATRSVVDHFLKTTAIMMQLQSGGDDFRQVLRPQITASR